MRAGLTTTLAAVVVALCAAAPGGAGDCSGSASGTAKFDVPVLALQTDLTDGGVLKGARELIRRAKAPKRRSVLLNSESEMSHLDPLTPLPERNPLV